VKLRLAERLSERVPDRSSGFAASALEPGPEGSPAPAEGCVSRGGPLGSAAFAFGTIENFSWKLCAAAGFPELRSTWPVLQSQLFNEHS
jgi:hypothetical protein